MIVFLNMIPPTVTHQEKQVTVRNGKPIFYEPSELKDARDKFMAYLHRERPPKPFQGPIRLKVAWMFPKGSHRHGEWKTTKPDTDNLQKLLKDCMTNCGYWKDDAQVCMEHIMKVWSDTPGIWIEIDELNGRRK